MNSTNSQFLNHSVCWSAIFSGIFIALTVATLLNFLGAGLNFISFTPSADKETLLGMGTFALIWVTLTSLFSMFTGGWVAGRMSGVVSALEGALHGITMYGVTLFLTFILVTFIGSVTGIMSSIITVNALHQEENKEEINEANDTAKQMWNAQQEALSHRTEQQPKEQKNRANQDNQKSKAAASDISKISGAAAFILFISFFLSALSSGLGGMYGATSGKQR